MWTWSFMNVKMWEGEYYHSAPFSISIQWQACVLHRNGGHSSKRIMKLTFKHVQSTQRCLNHISKTSSKFMMLFPFEAMWSIESNAYCTLIHSISLPPCLSIRQHNCINVQKAITCNHPTIGSHPRSPRLVLQNLEQNQMQGNKMKSSRNMHFQNVDLSMSTSTEHLLSAHHLNFKQFYVAMELSFSNRTGLDLHIGCRTHNPATIAPRPTSYVNWIPYFNTGPKAIPNPKPNPNLKPNRNYNPNPISFMK